MKKVNCTEHIALACSAIHSSIQSVKTIFYGKELCEVYSSYKEEKDFLLEIRFDTATLACLFDDNNICEGAFLFLDDLMDITYYIEHCNKTYTCDMILNGWVVNDYLIQIHTENQECSLMILPIKAES